MISTTNKNIVFLFCIASTMGQIASYLYIPALPVIGRDLHLTPGIMETSISVFLIAFGVSQICYGSLSDALGRKKVLAAGVIIIIIGSVMAAFARSGNELILARFIQGLGAGAPSVIARTMIKDCIHDDKLSSAVAMLVLFATLTPAVSPFICGFILSFLAWQWIFIIIIIYVCLLMLLFTIILPETHHPSKRTDLAVKTIVQNYINLLKSRDFLVYVSLIVLGFALVTLYIAMSPYVFQKQFGFTPFKYGIYMLFPMIGFAIGSMLAPKLNLPIRKITCLGAGLVIITSLILLLLAVITNIFPFVVVLLISIITIGSGLTYPMLTASMLKEFSKTVGVAASFSGAIQISGSGVIVYIVALLDLETVSQLALSTLAVSIIMFILMFLLPKTNEKASH